MNNTREKILLAAIDLFSSVGYSEGSMRELASRVGIKAASIYNHYPSKDALLDDILNFFLETDQQHRVPPETFIVKSQALSVPEILNMMFVDYKNETDYYLSIKILKIAVGYQFEYPKVKQIFDYIFYEVSLNYRKAVLRNLVACGILQPFDVDTVAYVMTACSITRLMESMNSGLSLDEYSSCYFQAMARLVELVSPLIRKTG